MIRLHSTGLNDATILSNIFIDRFMPKANGEFVKVYIYLLRMLGRPEEAFGLSQMADSLFCTEGDILRALKYWESEKLITLLYEEAELTGITLQAPWNEANMLATVAPAGICNAGSLSDVPDTYHISAPESPAVIPNAPTDNPLQTDQISYRSADLPVTPSSKPLSETKALTPDRVKELKQNEDIIQLLYIAEQYLGKTLTPTETRKILFFYDELHMSVDLIDYLIEYCVGRDHRSIRYIETVAMAWREEGITTVEMAKGFHLPLQQRIFFSSESDGNYQPQSFRRGNFADQYLDQGLWFFHGIDSGSLLTDSSADWTAKFSICRQNSAALEG